MARKRVEKLYDVSPVEPSTQTSADIYTSRLMILGCGNILRGDDGFGPAVVKCIGDEMKLPDDAAAIDVGSSLSTLILRLLSSEEHPKGIVIIDSIECGGKPGEIFQVKPEDIPKTNMNCHHSHLFPSPALLEELEGKGIEVMIIACQVSAMTNYVQSGLSEAVRRAVPGAAKLAVEHAERILKAR